MGDTLKDCCAVLRTETCLLAAYQLIMTALARGPEAVSWQEIEAPLFAMRSMGAEVDSNDSIAVPKIMDLIPSLPNHPRVRYAALLIISRYTEWIDVHPQYIPFQLQYISAGFEDSDAEVCAASGQALKYMCQDCKQHLTDFLPTLHNFLTTKGVNLVQEDRRQVYEAIAYVISAMPMNRAAESLKTFSLDILAQVHAMSSKTTAPTKQEIEEVGNGLENLEVMLHVVQGYGEELPPACQDTCQDAWLVFDTFLSKYSANYDLSERATRVLRRGIDLFNKSALPVATSVLARMSFAFESTGYPSFLWIAGKIIGRFGYEEDSNFRGAVKELFERSTTKVASLLQVKTPGEIPDVLEDYIQMLLQFVPLAPDILFISSAFPLAFRAAMTGLTVVHTDIIFAALDFFRVILTHDCLDPQVVPPPKFPIYATAIHDTVRANGLALVACILNGLVGDFPEEATATIVSIFRVLVYFWSTQLSVWLPQVLEQLPPQTAPPQSKSQFLSEVSTAINTRQQDKVRYAILAFDRASRKARDRRRNGL
jgi:transportin-3